MNRSPEITQADQEQRGDRSGRLICVGDPSTVPTDIDQNDVIVVDTSVSVLDELKQPSVEGVWIARDQFPKLSELRGITQSGVMLRDMPEGVALLDSDIRVLWGNRRLEQWSGHEGALAGLNFYELLSNPEIMGPDFCPFHTALATGEESKQHPAHEGQSLLPRARRPPRFSRRMSDNWWSPSATSPRKSFSNKNSLRFTKPGETWPICVPPRFS